MSDSEGLSPPKSSAAGTALWALALLFFLQLYTLFIESMYRLSLIKLSMGWELLGAFFLLTPLIVVLLGKRGEWLVYLAAGGVICTRVAAPFLDVRLQITVAGAGVACSLVLVCYAVSGSPRIPRADPAAATALAVLASIVLRHILWTTLDVSMEPRSAPSTLPVLFLLAILVWLRGRGRGTTPYAEMSSLPHSRTSHVLAQSLVLFASLALIYLVALSPGVTCAWSGSSLEVTVFIAIAVWTGALYLRGVSSGALLGWNVTFLALLIGGIAANMTSFPTSPDARVVVDEDRWWQHAPLYAAIALSPVLAFNIHAVLGSVRTESERLAATAVFLGVMVLFVTTLLLIFTNVWGYVEPVSPWFRNHFYLTFAILGGALIVGLTVLRRSLVSRSHEVRSRFRTPATALAVVFLAWMGADFTVDKVSDELTVLTYNIQQGSQEDGNQRYLEQLDFIRSTGAKVILLQESDTPRPSGGLVDAPRLFADALGMNLYYGPKTVTGTFGTAILSRVPLENPRTVFTYSDADEVGTAMAEIDWKGQRILLINNHPAGSDEVKHAHVDAVIEVATGYDAAIAGGDFNFEQNSPYYRKMAERLRDTWLMLHPDGIGDEQSVASGFSGDPARFDMRERIDHIFVSDGFEVEGAIYFLPPDSRTDHPAYICFIRPPGATPR